MNGIINATNYDSSDCLKKLDYDKGDQTKRSCYLKHIDLSSSTYLGGNR
jgi:hypothetical protein